MSVHTDFFDDVYSKYIGLKPDRWFAPTNEFAQISPEVGELAKTAYEAVLHLKFELACICDKEIQRAKKDGEQWVKNWECIA